MNAYLALGSNLGDRGRYLAAALAGLAAHGLEPQAFSSVWETEPVGAQDADPYWNMAVRVETDLSARALLACLMTIENSCGRTRERPNAPRTLDIDLLLLGELTIDEPGLSVPHPRMWGRSFVLAPLAEIAPQLRNPATGRTIDQEILRIAHPTAVSRLDALDRCPTVLL